MAYTSSTLTLAMLEFLAQIDIDDFDPSHSPELAYITADIANTAVLTLAEIGATLTTNWDDIPAPAIDAAIGDAWIADAGSLALSVPSVHVPSATPERNVLLNPLHSRFSEVRYTSDDFAYDRRLLATRRAHEKRGKS